MIKAATTRRAWTFSLGFPSRDAEANATAISRAASRQRDACEDRDNIEQFFLSLGGLLRRLAPWRTRGVTGRNRDKLQSSQKARLFSLGGPSFLEPIPPYAWLANGYRRKIRQFQVQWHKGPFIMKLETTN